MRGAGQIARKSVPLRVASGILADVVRLGGMGQGEPLWVSNRRTLPHMWCQLGTILFLPTTEKKGGLFLGSFFCLCRPAGGEEKGRKFGFVSVFFCRSLRFLALVLCVHK